MAIADGWTGPTIAAPRGTMYNPVGATPYGQVQQTTPAAAYRPTYGVTYQGQTQPTSAVPMTPISAVPMSSMVSPPRPMPVPTRPSGVVQQTTASAPLTGTNALAGTPGGPYTAMPGGFAGGYAGATGLPAGGILGTGHTPYEEAKARALAEYDPINIGTAGGLLASAAGLVSPIAGLLNAGRHVYNTEETAAYQSKLGEPMGWLDRLLGYFGFTDASGGSIAADRATKTATGEHPNQGGMKMNMGSSSPVAAGKIGYKPGATPSGQVMGYSSGPSAGGSSNAGSMRDPNSLVGTIY